MSVAYIGPKSRTEKPRNPKIGTEVMDLLKVAYDGPRPDKYATVKVTSIISNYRSTATAGTALSASISRYWDCGTGLWLLKGSEWYDH